MSDAKPSRELVEAVRAAMFELPLCMGAADCRHLIRVFAANGLALVPAADVPTPEERAVLKECATEGGIKDWADRVWEKERARREASRAAKEST